MLGKRVCQMMMADYAGVGSRISGTSDYERWFHSVLAWKFCRREKHKEPLGWFSVGKAERVGGKPSVT
jgi:hypothetical protein